MLDSDSKMLDFHKTICSYADCLFWYYCICNVMRSWERHETGVPFFFASLTCSLTLVLFPRWHIILYPPLPTSLGTKEIETSILSKISLYCLEGYNCRTELKRIYKDTNVSLAIIPPKTFSLNIKVILFVELLTAVYIKYAMNVHN